MKKTEGTPPKYNSSASHTIPTWLCKFSTEPYNLYLRNNFHTSIMRNHSLKINLDQLSHIWHTLSWDFVMNRHFSTKKFAQGCNIVKVWPLRPQGRRISHKSAYSPQKLQSIIHLLFEILEDCLGWHFGIHLIQLHTRIMHFCYVFWRQNNNGIKSISIKIWQNIHFYVKSVVIGS